MALNDKHWSCEQVEGRLSDYLDRLLGAHEQGGFEAHISECGRCASLVQRVAGLLTEMHGMEPLPVPPRLHYEILDRTLGPRARKTRGWRAWVAWLRPVWQLRFAYGAVSVVISFAVLFQALDIQWRKPRLADLNPVNVYRAIDRRAHLVYARGSRFVMDLRVVYEIQSRLRPEAVPQVAPEPQPRPSPRPGQSPGQSNAPEPKSRREFNRANEMERNFSVLACALGTVPARSLR